MNVFFSTMDNPQHKLLHELFLNNKMDEAQKETYINMIPSELPYKGYGSIVVDNEVKAKEILENHFNENERLFEMDYYPFEKVFQGQVGFIQKDGEETFANIYLGKFEIPKFNQYILKLANAGIKVIRIHIESQSHYYDY